jgi:hypothetical protein
MKNKQLQQQLEMMRQFIFTTNDDKDEETKLLTSVIYQLASNQVQTRSLNVGPTIKPLGVSNSLSLNLGPKMFSRR